jgi:hypothetical protein
MKTLNLLSFIIVITSLTLSVQAGNNFTWLEDVSPIIHKNCVICHRPGEIGPMSLLNYQAARPWAKSIKEAVMSRTMPPWHADSSKTKFANDPSLSEEQIQKISQWVDSGAPIGNPEFIPALPDIPNGWMMGEPDLIFYSVGETVVPANNPNIDYSGLIFDTLVLTEDLWIQGWELRPTIMGIVHHANLALSPVPFNTELGGDVITQAARPGGDYVGSYLPGCRPMYYPAGMAYLMPKGSNLAIQMHVIGVDKDINCGMMFGVKFAQGRIDKRIRIVGLIGVDNNIDIEPYEKDYVLAAEAQLLFDTIILSSGAHMHTRGSAYTHQVIDQITGRSTLIAEVPRYDFNWQQTYWLSEPVFAVKGSLVRTIAHYNNSADNPTNVDPSQRVKHGPWTSDEMLNAWAHSVIADEKLGFNIENGHVVGKFEDAQIKAHPFLLQSLKCNVLSEDGAYEEVDLSIIIQK